MQVSSNSSLLAVVAALQPDVPALIWQIGNLESRLHTGRVSRPERFERFVRHLRQHYAGDHKVIAVYAPAHPLMPADVIRCALTDLPQHAHRIHAGFSLYVPRAGQRPIQDLDLLAKVDDPQHLANVTS